MSIHAPKGGLGLLWLAPWDGREALSPAKLDPYYVEICRRVRLRHVDGRIVAMRGSSEDMRVDQPKIKHAGKEHTMPTGDPWTPVAIEGSKPLTVDGTGFTYRRIVNLLDDGKYAFAPLQHVDECEERRDAARVRRHRAGPRRDGWLSRTAHSDSASSRAVLHAQEPIASAGEIGPPARAGCSRTPSSKALRPALFNLFQSAPAKIDYGDPKAKVKAELYLAAFNRSVDEDFFDRLFDELVEEPESDAARQQRRTWIDFLEARAMAVLATAEAGSPLSHVRRYRARAAAERVLVGALRRHFKDVFSEAT